MADYELIETDMWQLEAIGFLLAAPNRIMFRGDFGKGSISIYDRSKKKTTYFYPKNSESLRILREEADKWGFDSPIPSWGRLSKHFFKEYLSEGSGLLPYPSFSRFEKEKKYWHNCHIQRGFLGDCVELDLKSAYYSAIKNQPTLFLKSPGNWIEDGGALGRLENLIPTMSKRFRLIFIGVFSSSWTTYLQPRSDNPKLLEKKSFPLCNDGGFFNTIHYSLYSLWQFIDELKNLLGPYCVRTHTDSLLISDAAPNKLIKSLLKMIEKKGYRCAIKGAGPAYFWDLNTGIIGGKVIGGSNVIPYLRNLNPEIIEALKIPFEIPKIYEGLDQFNERLSVSQILKLSELNYDKVMLEFLKKS